MNKRYLMICSVVISIILSLAGCQGQQGEDKVNNREDSINQIQEKKKGQQDGEKNPIQVINDQNNAEMNNLIQSVDEYEKQHKLDINPEGKEACYAELYKMNLHLDREKKRISGKMQITVHNQTSDILSEVCIRNYAGIILKEYGKGDSKIYNCAVNGKREGISLEYKKKDPSVLYMRSKDVILAPGGSAVVELEFDTSIPKKKDRFGYAEYDGKEFYQLSFCFPTIDIYEDGKWNENPYISSNSESNYTRCSEYDVTIQVPEGFDVIATGKESVEGQAVRITEKNIRELAMVISDGLTRKTDIAEGVTINSYGLDYENNVAYNGLALQAAKDSLELYTRVIGEYPYEELDVVQVFMDSAMEYPGMIMVGLPDASPEQYKDLDQTYSYDIELCCKIAHETAHQWFYGTVGNDPYKEPWLDEGFAEYCEEILYPQSGKKSIADCAVNDDSDGVQGKQSKEEFEKWRQIILEQTNIRKPVNGPLDSYDVKEDEYSECVYQGGSMFLYELQKAMGNDEFFYALRVYYKAYYLKEATTEGFLDIIRKVAKSERVEKIIKKYIK